jgi:hypothetical protein
MKTSIYAMLAVILGVALVTVVPGGITMLASPTRTEVTIQLQSPGSTEITRGNTSGTFGSVVTSLPKNNTTSDAPKTASDDTGTKTDSTQIVKASYDPFNDLGYYGLWGLGLVAASIVYLISKRLV